MSPVAKKKKIPMGVLLKGIVLFTAAARREAIDESELRICLSGERCDLATTVEV
jgi:hypothetical protein